MSTFLFRGLALTVVCVLLLLLQGPPSTVALSPLVVYTYNEIFTGNATFDPFVAYGASRNLNSSNYINVYVFDSGDLPLVISSPTLAQQRVLMPPDFTTQGSSTPIPLPDVVIGLDTVEAQLSPSSSFIDFSLISGPLDPAVSDLGGLTHLHPFDFGVILLIYDQSVTPQFQALEANFTLESLFTSGLINGLVVEDPTLDTTGEAFLLTTIGVYGDNSIGLKGIADPALGDWTHFWSRAFATNMTVSPTWSAAYDVFYSDGSIPLMVSFGTDPADAPCSNGTNTIRTLTHHDSHGQPWAWAMVEGIAVVSSTTNRTFAEDFVNFWFTLGLQSNIWVGQYMVPTLLQAENTTEPLCYQQSPVTLPRNVNLFNAPFFANGTVQANFARWKSTWASMYAGNAGNARRDVQAVQVIGVMLMGMIMAMM